MSIVQDIAGFNLPLPWRKSTHLHHKLGPRALRYVYTGGAGLPLNTAPAQLMVQFGAQAAIDRIVGYSLSIGVNATAANFYLQEANTGFRLAYSYAGGRGLFLQGNLETLADVADLFWWFDAALSVDVVLTFYNIELVPAIFA